MAKSGLPHHALTIEALNLRLGKLKELAKKSVHGERHEIYNEKREKEMTDKEKLEKANKQLKEIRQGNRIHNTAIFVPPGATSEVYA